jgi:hypothetical protein
MIRTTKNLSFMPRNPMSSLAVAGVVAASLALHAFGATEAAPPSKQRAVHTEVASAALPSIPGVSKYEVAQFALPSGIPEVFDVAIMIDGVSQTVRLYRTSMRAAGARMYLDRGNGVLEEAPLPPHRTYRGTVLSTGERVAASLIDGRLWASVDREFDTLFVQPMSDFATNRPSGEHVIYSHGDVAPFGDHRCGNDETKLAEPDWMSGVPTDPLESGSGGSGTNGGEGGVAGGGEGGVAGANPFMTEIAFDADYEFFQKNGSNAANTVNDIELVMNSVSLVYDRDVNINYEYTAFVIRTTTSDPYTTSVMTDLLCEFRTKWNTTPENQIQRDVAQLFTGKTITGSVIGLAWLGVVCNQSGNDCAGTGNLAYSAVESRFTNTLDFRVSLSAHEIGHNWQAQHCDSVNPCNIMCSIINSCQGTLGTNLKFSATEQSQITGFRNSVGCDVALPAPIALPFFDGFDAATTLSTTNWIYSKGGSVSTAAVSEPSPTRSLNLDAISNLEYGDDEVRSNFMLLSGLPTVYFAYATQHRGVEAGKQLVVEYLNNVLDWVVINTITSTGTDQTTFATWQHTLPANAKHNKFRIRFRTLVDGQDDDWYIDNVSVSAVVLPANDECANAIFTASSSIAFDTTNATNSPSSLPVSCDEGNGLAMAKDVWYLVEAPCQGNMTVSTCGTAGFDTRLAAYTLACPPTGSLVGCADNTAGCTGNTSSMTFAVNQGTGILIRVGGVTTGGTGTLNISCVPVASCPEDIDGDGVVGAADLSEVLNSWGSAGADLNGDGTTDAADLASVLGAWGDCP